MSEDPKPAAEKAKETIYVDVEDDITAIIDKVEAAKAKLVALVLPKRSSAMQSIVNMRLLKRSSESSGKNLVLITSETALLPLAGAAKIHVAKNLQSAPDIPPAPGAHHHHADEEAEDHAPTKIDYDKPHGEIAAGDPESTIPLKHPEADTKRPVHKPAKDKKLAIPNFDMFKNRLGLAIAAVIALFLFFVVGGRVLPKATITLQTTSEPV